jgi:hypothetical protein
MMGHFDFLLVGVRTTLTGTFERVAVPLQSGSIKLLEALLTVCYKYSTHECDIRYFDRLTRRCRKIRFTDNFWGNR